MRPEDLSEIRRILDFLRNSRLGMAGWLVGGCVRDWLLHRSTNDIDLVVSQHAFQLARAVADAFGGAFFVLDHERDVARAIVPRREGQALEVDVARLRAETLSGDLSLRDFTVNTLAVPITSGTDFLDVLAEGSDPGTLIIDLFGGRQDLAQALIRAVSEGAFLDDPLRMLRAVRQAAEFSFRIEDATYNLVRRDARSLGTVSPERARDELERVLRLPDGRGCQCLRDLQKLGLLVQVLPEASALAGVSQSPPHYQDAFEHTLSVMAYLEGLYGLIWPEANGRRPMESMRGDSLLGVDESTWSELHVLVRSYRVELGTHMLMPVSKSRLRKDCLRWAALAHDWGKPATRSIEGTAGGQSPERARFLGHEQHGSELVESRLETLRMSSAEIDHIARVVRLHMRPGQLAHAYPPTHRAVYRFFRDSAGTGPDILLLSLADFAAVEAGMADQEPWAKRLSTADRLLGAYFRQRPSYVDPPPLLDGRQVMAILGVDPGPQVGHVLESLREAQASGEVTSLEEALAWLAKQKG